MHASECKVQRRTSGVLLNQSSPLNSFGTESLTGASLGPYLSDPLVSATLGAAATVTPAFIIYCF